MGEKKAGVKAMLGRLFGFWLIVMLIFAGAGCKSGGGGTGGSATSSDQDLQKIADELKRLGDGKWEITNLERDGNVLNISMKVPDDPGKVTFREAQSADEAIHKIIPQASGKVSWISVQGIGLRTVLLEPELGGEVEPSAEGEEGASEGHDDDHGEENHNHEDM